ILALMAANGSQGLFNRVILQSGTSQAQISLGQDEGESRGANLMSGLCPQNASQAAARCLRHLSVQDILGVQASQGFDPTTAVIRRPGLMSEDISLALEQGNFTGNA